ncbi:hypothetical protein CDN99_25545 [Roseateles aquatilis]|uniref:Replication gene A protein-like domain-containing protein n=1 Tax=Roseateles aquatilis TaxID=431061 RepID=A0A246IUE4_9BURK|nr:replication endonuclease [Roseateles aquatilis]OWQ83833.1 hypothetical protein CDN99_25545 [Roseateles aquatilis]
MSLAQGLAGLASPHLYDLPAADWETPSERRQRREAEERAMIDGMRWSAVREIADAGHARVTAPIDPHAPDRALCDLARRRADFMLDAISTAGVVITREWLNEWLVQLEARPFDPYAPNGGPVEDQLAGMVKRASCAHWWRRQVRRAAVRKREAQAQARGLISVRTSQPYVTDETLQRRAKRQASNRAILENTEIESPDGEVINLWAAVDASTANKAVRRGELMTRIRGCDEWAQARGLAGVFTTNTLPSRFHAQRFKGGQNPAWDGSTPRDGQRWLCKTWARVRAALHRERIGVFGFRIAEPHHDGCPHWHMLLWAEPEKLEKLQAVMRAHWLKDAGDEPGAANHRVKFERLDPKKGSAAAYVSKYIAKNIDDAGAVGAEGHRDDRDGEQLEIVEGGNKAARVEAWAGEWGIRQFQAIGQPPVTVWRELRRVEAQAVEGMSHRVRTAHEAVNRDGERRACWRAYMDAQGGAMVGRDYGVRVIEETEGREGRYGMTYLPRPVGVFDAERPQVLAPSNRKQWRPKGTWGADERQHARKGLSGWARDTYLRLWARSAQPAAQPWTRVINCTRRAGAADLIARMDAWQKPSIEGPGGHLDSTSWANLPTPPAPSPNSPPSWSTRLEALRSFRPDCATT